MSFWDRLGDAAQTVGHDAEGAWGKAWTIAAQVPGTPQNSADALKQAFSAAPAQHVLSDLHKPYEYAIARPASTIAQLSPMSTGNLSSITSIDDWRKAWDRSATLSPGQAEVLAVNNAVGRTIGKQVALNTPEQRQDFFTNTWAGRLSSGTVDFGLNWFADPLVVGGKAAEASRLARTTVQTGDRSGALAFSAGKVNQAQINKSAAKSGKQIAKLFTATDPGKADTASKMFQLPQFRANPEAAPLAYFFEKANQIADPAARSAAKADYLGVALGDAGSIQRVSADTATAQAWQRMLDVPESSEAAQRFSFADGGQAEFDFLNSPEKLAEIESQSDALSQRISHLQNLLGSAGVTNVVGASKGQAIVANLRLNRLSESIGYGGPADRPVRFIVGAPGGRIDGHVNTVDVVAGHDELTKVLGRAGWMDSTQKAKYLQEFAQAPSREDRATVLWRVENAMFTAAGTAYGKTPAETRALLSAARNTRTTWRSALQSRLYSATDPNAVVGAIDPDGVANVYHKPFLKSQIEDAVPLTDPKVLDQVMRHDARTGVLKALATGAMNTQDFVSAGLHGMMHYWKLAALLRPAYIPRVQVDTQLRLLAGMGAMQYASRLRNGAGHLLMDIGEKKLAAASDIFHAKDSSGRLFLKPQTYKGVEIAPAHTPEEAAQLAERLRGHTAMDLYMSDATQKQLDKLRLSGDWGVVRGSDANWQASYLRAVNEQIRNSPTATAMLATDSDAAILRQLSIDPAMRKEWGNFKDSYSSPEEWLATVRAHVNHTLPQPELRVRAAERPLTGADVREFHANEALRPPVHGENYVPTQQTDFTRGMTTFRNWWFRFASDAPESVMGRHPFYDYRFREHMKALVDRHPDETLDGPALDQIRRTAGNLARKDVANTLFDVSKQSGMAHSAALFSPFFSAWEDTMKKWGGLFYQDPSRAMHFAQGWEGFNNQTVTPLVDSNGYRVTADGKHVDKDGKEVAANLRGQGEYLVLPSSWMPGFGKGSHVKVSKNSFNLIFQGQPWWLPGPGPLASVPANEIVRRAFPTEESNPVLKYLLPYGTTTDSVPTQLMPNWWKQARDAFGGTQDYANTYALLMAQEQVKKNLGQRDSAPTPAEIAKKTRNWYLMRALVTSSSPVSATPNPEFQFYIDKAHEYQKQFGQDWQTKYYQDFPDYFEMSVSLSNNETGIQATAQAFDATKKYRSLIAQNPEYGWMFVGPDNAPGFDQGVYTWQQGTSTAPGSSQKFRDKKDPAQAIADVEASKGWVQYNKATTAISMALESRGLHSLSQNGAEDLQQAKDAYVSSLRGTNPSWSRAYDQQDSGKARSLLEVASNAMSQNKALAVRSDMVALSQYMQGRDVIRQLLEGRSPANGNLAPGEKPSVASIDLPQNRDLKTAWDAFTQALAHGNLGFEGIYNRVLEHDNLSQELELK